MAAHVDSVDSNVGTTPTSGVRTLATSRINILDKAVLVLTVVEDGPKTLAGLMVETGMARPTVDRLARSLEHHGLLARNIEGMFVLGPRVVELAAAAANDGPTLIE